MTTAEDSEPTPKLIGVVVVLLAAAVLLFHVRRYPVLTYDDAFISLRYAQRLLEGHGLTWTEGPPVEGYSNLLWVLGCAFLAALGVDLLDAPVVLGVVSAIATIAALVYAFPPRSWGQSLPALAGATFLALAGPIGLWAVAGLEGCMVAALLAWSLVLLRPLLDGEPDLGAALRAGIPLALLCLTRPDGPLIVVIICGFLLVRARSRRAVTKAIAVGVIPGIATIGQVAFRLAYYGEWLPNTARAKVAFSAARIESGAQCVGEAAVSSWALWGPALLALYVAWRDPHRRSRILLSLTLFAAWTGYSATVTCQPYGFRMLIPSFVMLCFLVSDTLDWVQDRKPWVRAVAWIATVAFLYSFGSAQQAEKNIVLAREYRPPVTEQASTIGRTLRLAFGTDDPLVAVDAAGAIPFYSGLRSLDMLGLNDAHIARHRDETFGQGIQGHELGDGAYVLSQEPDLIVTGRLGASRPSYSGGREMKANPLFAETYRRVRVYGDDPVPLDFYLFARLEGRTGVERSNRLLRIPGYLFATGKGTRAELGNDGALETRYLDRTRAKLAAVVFPVGTWRISASGRGSFLISTNGASIDATGSQTSPEVHFVIEEEGPIDIAVTAGASAILTEVVARRIGD